MEAVIVRCVRLRFMFAALHVLLLNVRDLLYQKYKCLSQNNIHLNEQALQVDDARYDWRCTLSGWIYIMCCVQRKATPRM